MTSYKFDMQLQNILFKNDELNFKEFESCIFTNCIFSDCNFTSVAFMDCVFEYCTFDAAKINHVALRSVHFINCKIREVNFALCERFIFEVQFTNCILDFSKFYDLKMKNTIFTSCSLVAVDFMQTDLTAVVFDKCDLYKAEFEKANAQNTNFKTSINYTIDPKKTKIKKAIFSKDQLNGLLFKHEIFVVLEQNNQ